MHSGKCIRERYFLEHRDVVDMIGIMGLASFSKRYEAFFNFYTSLHPGQFFYVRDIVKDKENIPLVFIMLDIIYNMDIFEDMDIDMSTTKVVRNAPYHIHIDKFPYIPVNYFPFAIREYMDTFSVAL